MGTSWSVRFAAPFGCDASAIEAAVMARLDAINAEMSHWRPDSAISRFNQAASGTWVELPADFAAVIDTALEIARRSQGAFDPAIGRIVALRGFGPNPAGRSEDAREIEAAQAAAGWQRLCWDRPRLLQPGGLAIDLSGIAKGYAVDAVADHLAGNGIDHALVEIGGELVGRGVRPDGDPWWVDLEDPPGIALPRLRIALHGLAVATSGDYRRGAHSIDPASGRSIDNGIRSVSVIHKSAMLADAWATALTVLGIERGLALATQEALAVRFVSEVELLSPALAAMLDY